MPRPLLALTLGCLLVSAAACHRVDLATAVEITDVFTGWYDSGIKDGKNYLVPSITFQLKNKTPDKIRGVQVTVSFWRDGDDGEWESVLVGGVGGMQVPGGGSTDPITVRANVGHTLEAPRSELFSHSMFKDTTARIFAKQFGGIVKLGEFKLDRRIIPHASSGRP